MLFRVDDRGNPHHSPEIPWTKRGHEPFPKSANASHKSHEHPHSSGKGTFKPSFALFGGHTFSKILQKAWSPYSLGLRFIPSRFISIISAILLLTHGSLFPAVVSAQLSSPTDLNPSEEILEELKFLQEETVSIAVLHEQPISEAPSNVYVITDDDIRHSGATDLPTVLRRIPGMEVIQMTGADINVSVRGDNQLRANKLLIMVDGRSIYLDMQGEVFWKAIPVTLPEIKRIEVLKGPASALYGFNAFDGIINIITKPPEEIKGSTFQVGGGEFGPFVGTAIQSGS